MRQVIGFGDNYYTLWEGDNQLRYIKNISKDLETAKKKYPKAEVDLGLKGMRWTSSSSIEIEKFDDRFNFGKYQGVPFKYCDDVDYMKWYANQLFAESQEWKNLTDVLKTFGYVIERGHIYTKEAWEKVCRYEREKEQFEEALSKGLPFEHEFEYNYTDFSHYGIRCKFENVKEMGNAYYGNYYLPIDGKGKAKRIKGKTVQMTKYEVVDNEVIIKEFQIV